MKQTVILLTTLLAVALAFPQQHETQEPEAKQPTEFKEPAVGPASNAGDLQAESTFIKFGYPYGYYGGYYPYNYGGYYGGYYPYRHRGHYPYYRW